MALKVFSVEELEDGFRAIKTLGDACDALELKYISVKIHTEHIYAYSKASAAMLKLNIIRKALNLGQDLRLTKDQKNSYSCYHSNPFITLTSTHYTQEFNDGLGNFSSFLGVGTAAPNIGF